jgi:hypothetical protein
MPRAHEKRRDPSRVNRRLTVIARKPGFEQVCLLTNASDGGVGLRINPLYELPKRFTLVCANVEAPVRLRWRRRDQAGVAFGFNPAQSPEAMWIFTGRRIIGV